VVSESAWKQWKATWTFQNNPIQLEMPGSKEFSVLKVLVKLMELEPKLAPKESPRRRCSTHCSRRLVKSQTTM